MKERRFSAVSMIVAAVLSGVILFGEPVGIYTNMKPGFIDTVYAAEDSTDTDKTAETDSSSEDTSSEEESRDLNYVSEVRLFDSLSADNAKQACKDAGYILVDSDLNQGTGKDAIEDMVSSAGDGAYVYLGYKTTKNRDEAITSMKMVEMDTGYSTFDYETVEQSMSPSMAYLAEDIVAAAAEVIKNKAAGDICAEKAQEYLNLYYIPYLRNKGLGDFLIGESANVSAVTKLLKRTNPSVISYIMSALSLGVSQSSVSGYSGNLAQRIADTSESLADMKKSDYISLDSYYSDEVKDLKEALQSFSNEVEPALKTYYDNDSTLDEDFLKAYPYEAICVQVYNRLNEYTMADGTKVGSYLLALGSSSLSAKSDIREGYALVMSLSAGQLLMMRYAGLIDAVNYMDASSDAISFCDERLSTAKEKIKEVGLKETSEGIVPIYAGDNDTLYKSEVAMSDAAKRAASAKNEYHELTQFDKDMALWEEVLKWSGVVLSVSMAAYFIGALAVKAFVYFVGKEVLKRFLATTVGMIFSALGWTVKALGYNLITLVVYIVVMVIWYVTVKIKGYIDKYNPDMSEVPHFLYDVSTYKDEEGKKQTKYTLYQSTYNAHISAFYSSDSNSLPEWTDYYFTDSSDEINKAKKANAQLYNDFNAGQGKKWNGLYYTKDPDAGSPICAEDVNDIFLVKKGEYKKKISGYTAFSGLGSSNPINLNSNQYHDHVNGIYLYYRTEKTLDDPEYVMYGTDGKYVSDLIIVSEKKEKDAKAEIKMKQGDYEFMDYNLTPDNGYYTYLGYATTDNVDDAIRDIRVDVTQVENSASGGYTRGNISYGYVGKTGTGISMYQSAVKSSEKEVAEDTYMSAPGAPILADFVITDAPYKAPAGYEPVILGAGSAPYNFNTQFDSASDKNMRFIYFQPAVSYVPEGTEVEEKDDVTYVYSDTQYLAGVNTLIGHLGGGNTLKAKARALGYQVVDINVLKNHDYSNWQSFHGYFCYATTYNPYRAISDIRYFKGSAYANSIQSMAGSEDGVYLASDVYIFENDKLIDGYHGLAKSKAYTGFTEELLRLYPNYDYPYEMSESYESWQQTNLDRYFGFAARGLYTLGVDEEHPAIKASDFVIRKDATVPDGMLPIGYMTNKYSTYNYDLSVSNVYAIHFYLKREAPTRGKYISGINVASFTMPSGAKGVAKILAYKGADDSTMIQAASYGGEVLKTNIAVRPKYAWYNYLKYSNKVLKKGSGIEEKWSEVRQRNLYSFSYSAMKDSLPVAACQFSYVGVSRTDDINDAITGIIKYNVAGKEAPARINVGGVKYIKAGDRVGDYCYYYTKSANATPGVPITGLYFTKDTSDGNSGCILTAEKTDPKDLQQRLDAVDNDDDLEPYEKIIKKAEIRKDSAGLELKPQNELYGKLALDLEDTFITDIYIGKGSSYNEAAASAFNQGASFVYSYNTNMGLIGRQCADKSITANTYVSIGYDMVNENSCSDEELEEYLMMATKDILLTAGKPYDEDGFVKDGCEYYPISDISLNEGTDGKEIYMYTTMDETDKTASPICALALSRADSIPSKAGKVRYEYILTDENTRANLNDGSTALDGKKLIDTRLWLFAARLDNTVKSAAMYDITDYGRNTVRYNVSIR